jgi:hypothetical protein
MNANDVKPPGISGFLLELIALGIFGTGVWVFGEHLSAHGHTAIGSCVNYVACVMFFAIAPVTACRFWSYPSRVWSIFSVFCIILAVVFVASSRSVNQQKPRLKLNLIVSESTDGTVERLEFTNDCFFLKPGPLPLSAIRGCLLIPLAPGSSNAALRFMLVNDTQTTSEAIEAIFGIATNLSFSADPHWVPFSVPNTTTRYLSAKPPGALLPGDGQPLPDIRFINLTEGKFGEVFVTIRGKDFADVLIVFRVMFINSKDGKARIAVSKITYTDSTNWYMEVPAK